MTVFNTNRAFKLMGLFLGDFDGVQFSKNDKQFKLLYIYSRIWYSILIYDIIRFTTLCFIERDTVYGFYLLDFANLNRSRYYRWLLACGPLFNFWFIGEIRLFHQIYYDKKNVYWLRFFQIPKSKSTDDIKIEGYSDARLIKFWNLSSILQDFVLKGLIVSGVFTMTFGSLAYLIAMKKFIVLFTPLLFWSIAIANFISLIIIGGTNLIVLIGPIVYLFLICRILKERFDLISIELNKISNKSINTFTIKKIDYLSYNFNLIINDLQRCDYFWSKFNFLNVFFGVFICSVLLLNSLYADNLFIVMLCALLFVSVFVPVLVFTLFICGQVHESIKKSYNPLVKIIGNNKINLRTNARLLRIIYFIHSEYAGIRCSSIFLMKKVYIIEVFFEIITQSILIFTYSLYYNS